MNRRAAWAGVRETVLVLVVLRVNLEVAERTWWRSMAAFDDAVTHYSPAIALPVWQTLPFMGSAYLVVGGAMALWTRRWWVAGLPLLLSFFFALCGAHFGAEYYPQTVWDYLGRPTPEQVAVGIASAACGAIGWYLVDWVFRRFESRTTESAGGSRRTSGSS